MSVPHAISTDSSNNIHVVWDDETFGKREIHYIKGIQLNPRTCLPYLILFFTD